MKRALKPRMVALAGLGALALVSTSITTAAADGRAGEAGAPQLAHMGAGPGGGNTGGGHMMGSGMMGPGAMGQGYRMGPGMMGGGSGMMGRGQGMGPGMMGGGRGMGPGMTGQDCPAGSAMMGQGQQMGPGMMGPGMMGPGMMGPGQHMGTGMMGPGMRVVPQQDLTTDDVRHFFEDRLAWQGNKRLKIGEVKQADDDTITADIVTADNSLVRRFKIDRHTGRMQAVE